MAFFDFLNLKNYKPKILEISNETEINRDFIKDIFNRDLDLILVRNAIPEEIIKSVLNQVKNIPNDLTFPTPFGTIYGRTLIGSNNQMQNYSEVGTKLNQFIKACTGSDLNEISIESISRLAKKTVQVKLANVNDLDYAGYTLKVLNPKKGGLHVHIGSEFLKLLPECEDLANQLNDQHQISFFYVLQAPEKGGELTLFDLDWESSPKELIDNKGFYSHEEREAFFKKRKTFSIKPKAGDLIVFNGGNVWHKVEDIEGKIDRITVGGFLGISNKTSEILFWN